MRVGKLQAIVPRPFKRLATTIAAPQPQAVGSIGLNQNERCNLNPLNILIYPQKPMVKSKVLDFVDFDRLGAGQNAMVAVMSYSGYDIEDAVVLNKASLDRGYGRVLVIKRYTTVIKKHQNRTEDRIAPPPQRPPASGTL